MVEDSPCVLQKMTPFLDPFRAANYLLGQSRFRWTVVSSAGGSVTSSAGLSVQTEKLTDEKAASPDLVLVSLS